MIRAFHTGDLNDVMRIWLETNIDAHSFIPSEYWTAHAPSVRELLPQSELYVYEDDTGRIVGFIGMTEDFIEGIFVERDAQSMGVGRQLLNHVKQTKPVLRLGVYQKNARAISFYQKEQFAVQARDIDEGTGEAELLMIWRKDSEPSIV